MTEKQWKEYLGEFVRDYIRSPRRLPSRSAADKCCLSRFIESARYQRIVSVEVL